MDLWNTKLRSVCFGRASFSLSPATQNQDSHFISPQIGKKVRAELNLIHLRCWIVRGRDRTWAPGMKGVLSEGRNRWNAGARSRRQDKEKRGE